MTRAFCSGLTPKLMDGGLGTLARCLPLTTRSPGAVNFDSQTAPHILPGSGINANTIKNVIEVLWPLGTTEYHLSGGQVIQRQESSESRVGAERSLEEMGMGSSGLWMTQADVLREVRRVATQTIEDLRGRSSVER